MSSKSILSLLLLLLLLHPVRVYAQEEYVLPYPSAMPGSRMYAFHELWDGLQKYWHFGSLSQFRYSMQQSDKHLVEARTLFEYKQYLLADEALKNSDKYFDQARIALDSAEKEGKLTEIERQKLRAAAEKHRDVLFIIRETTPMEFIWQPERAASTVVRIRDDLDAAITAREACL